MPENDRRDKRYATDKSGWQASPSQLKLDTVRSYAKGRTALDLGCGRGWYAMTLAGMGVRVTGMDMVDQLDEDARRTITLIEGPITPPLPFADAAFNTVLMFDILEHLDDEATILAEVARVCRGRVIVSVPHRDAGPLPQYGLSYLHFTDDTHRREYLPAELEARFAAHGFRALWCSVVGQPRVPLAFSEFVRGGPRLRALVRYGITALYKIGLVYNESVGPDVFYVGERMA